jgi:hypothetical protein
MRNETISTAHACPLRLRLALAVLVLALARRASCQVTTGDVLGTVRDASGAVVPNANVTLTLIDRQEVRATTTDKSGDYTFTLLQSGNYSVAVEATGYAVYKQQSFVVNAGGRQRVDATLSIAGTTQSIDVNAAPPALDTDATALSTVVSQREVEDLPLNGRNFVQLAQLAAGSNEGTALAISNGNRPDDRRQTSSVVANAQSDTLNYEMVEGIDNNEGTVGTIGVRPSVEAIAEFRVITNMYPAEAGKTAGAVVNLITRSGTNAIHGSVYEFLRNDFFDARNFFATRAVVGKQPEFRQNQYGASLGGPILKNKTFYFVDFEGFRRIDATNALVNNVVPTAYEVAHPGDFSDRGGPVLSATQINPVGAKYFALYSAPNNGSFFTSWYPQTQNSTTADARVDHHFNENNTMFGRWTYNNVSTVTPSALPNIGGVDPGGSVSFPGPASQQAQQSALNFTHVFNPRLVLELKAGYTYISNVSLPLNYGKNYGNAFGVQNSNVDIFTSALPSVSVTGYAPLGDSNSLPLFDRDNIFQYGGTLTQVKGKNSFKYGAILVRRQIYNEQPTSGSGSFSFTTSPATTTSSALTPLVNLLEGNVFQASRVVQLYPRYLRRWEPTFFVEDDWRVRPNLTLNLGLRYDIITPNVDKNNHISHFDPVSGTFRVAGQNASNTADIQTYYKSIAPRFGIAFNPVSKTVLRGGFGLVFFRDDTGPSVPFADPPYVSTYSPNTNTTTFSTPLPLPSQASTTSPSGALRGMQLTYATSYVEQFNANVQQEIGFNTVLTVAYVGELGHSLRTSPNVNLGPLGLSTAGAYTTLRPFYSKFPGVTDIYNIESNGFSNYNSLQTTIVKQAGHGLTVQANYTWAHALGDVQGFSQGGLFTSADPVHTATVEYGNDELDVRNRVAMMLNYRITAADRLTGWRAVVAKGWQGNAIDVWETGQPFSVANSSPRANNGVNSDRPNQLRVPHVGVRTNARWFDTTAFAAQPLGMVGTTARNSLYGPPFRHFDLSLFKDFFLTEKTRLQFRAESFNLTNTPNFGQPGSTLGTSTFGVITSLRTNAQPRQLQFALRLSF